MSRRMSKCEITMNNQYIYYSAKRYLIKSANPVIESRLRIPSSNPVFESRLRIPASSPGSLFFWIPRSIPASSPGSLLFWIPRSIRLLVWSQILEISRLYFYLYLVENLEKNLWLIGLNVTKYKQIFLLLMKRAHCIRLPRVHSVRERDEKRAKKRNFHRGTQTVGITLHVFLA